MMQPKEKLHPEKNGLTIVFWVFTVLLGVALVAMGWVSTDEKGPVSRLVLPAMSAHLFYGVALVSAFFSRPRLTSVWVVLAISFGLRLILVSSPPVFSDDIFRYIWDGRMMTSGVNPYSFAPDAVEASSFGDPIWQNINHREFRTIYPPFAQIIFASIAFISPSIVAFKAVTALFDLGNVLLVILLAGGSFKFRLKSGDETCSKRAIIAGLAYGLNPLCCIETSMSGHLDSIGVFTVLLALLFLKKGRSILASFVIGLGTGIKLLPAIALPVIGRKRALNWLAFFAVTIGLYLPIITAPETAFETLDVFVRRWEGNGGLFAIVKWALTGIIGAFAGVTSINEIIHIRILDPVAMALQGTFFSLHKIGGFDPAHPGEFTLGGFSLAMTKVVMGLSFLGVVITMIIKRIEPVRAMATIFGAFLIVTPVLHPWYLIWVLPFAAALNLWPWMVLAALSTLAYLPLDGWWSRGVWHAPLWIQAVEYGGFASSIVIFLILKRRLRANRQA